MAEEEESVSIKLACLQFSPVPYTQCVEECESDNSLY